ncbi:MAG: protease complex subunit PrcB family protein [Pseudomonadales bacterium]|nr:protease complex subunit PrcB family protein [Pseudomonadales bacterium]
MPNHYVTKTTVGICVIAFLLTACSAAMKSLPVVSVYSSSQCYESDKKIRKMEGMTGLLSFVGKRSANILGAKPVSVTEINFETHNVYLVAMGMQPTVGYSVVVAGETAKLDGDTLILPVEFKTPREGSMQAQMQTSPCVVISLPKASYKRVLVSDLML